MAKKKKTNKKKKTVAVEKDPSLFWPIAGAVLLVVLSIFLLLGMFGTGGSLPTGMYGVVYGVLGFAAVLTPIAAGYWGILKFRHEDKRIPLAKLVGMLILILSVSSLMQVMFASKDATGSYGAGNGGGLGEILGGTVLNALDKIPASIMFFTISLFAFFWTGAVSMGSTYILYFRYGSLANGR